VAGDVNDHVPNVLEELPQPRPGRRVLAFCFVDPYSLKNLRFDTLSSLAARYMDFLVLIPTGYDATRNEGIYLRSDDRTVDRFLGNPDWRQDWREAQAQRQTFDHFMTDAFGHSMKGLGYIYEGFGNSHLVRSSEKKLRLYRLVLFSRHPLGAHFWREVQEYASDQRSLPF